MRFDFKTDDHCEELKEEAKLIQISLEMIKKRKKYETEYSKKRVQKSKLFLRLRHLMRQNPFLTSELIEIEE